MTGASSDPRIQMVAEALALAPLRAVGLDARHLMPGELEKQRQHAEELLVELDMHSPEPTIRRLQRDLHAAWGNDDVEWNLTAAKLIVQELDVCRGVLDALKWAFKNQELDGGWQTALAHPLYVDTEARIASLEDELRGLI